jgi:hypothetical protein
MDRRQTEKLMQAAPSAKIRREIGQKGGVIFESDGSAVPSSARTGEVIACFMRDERCLF